MGKFGARMAVELAIDEFEFEEDDAASEVADWCDSESGLLVKSQSFTIDSLD